MQLFIGQFNSQIFKDRLERYNLDLSIFLDIRPKDTNDLSKYNIIILQEPNLYFGHHNFTLQNADIFDLILTYNDLLLNRLKNAQFMPFGATWFLPEQYQKVHEKKFQIAHLCGKLKLTYGHMIRHELLAREDELDNIPKKFYYTYGSRDIIEEARIGKEEVFGDCQYGVCIENTSHRGYFTEKILDCFLLRTIPIYWGCSNIDDFFNDEGIIHIQNTDDAIKKINQLTPEFYQSRINLGMIDYNYKQALKYVCYENNILDKIERFLKDKGLI